MCILYVNENAYTKVQPYVCLYGRHVAESMTSFGTILGHRQTSGAPTCIRIASSVVCTASVSIPSPHPRLRFCAAPGPPALPPSPAPRRCDSNCTPNILSPDNVRRTCHGVHALWGKRKGQTRAFCQLLRRSGEVRARVISKIKKVKRMLYVHTLANWFVSEKLACLKVRDKTETRK